MTRIWTAIALLACCSTFLPQRSSGAEATTDGEADRLFFRGLELMRDDRCAEAVPLFERSQRLDPAPATLINLADCYARLGKTATAWRTFRDAAIAATAAHNEALNNQAAEATASVEKMLTQLRFTTADPRVLVTVHVNGVPVSDNRDPYPVDPGETSIKASAPGRVPWRTKLHAQGQGAVYVVAIPMLPLEHTPSPKPEPGLNLRPAALVLGGIGLTGLTLGVVWGLRAKSAYDSSNSQGACNSAYCNQTAHDLRDTAFDRAVVATWATVLGASAVAAGTVLWVSSPPRREKARLSLVPWFEPKQAFGGVIVEGHL